MLSKKQCPSSRKITVQISGMSQITDLSQEKPVEGPKQLLIFFSKRLFQKIKPEHTKAVFSQFSLHCLIINGFFSTFWNQGFFLISFQHYDFFGVCGGVS